MKRKTSFKWISLSALVVYYCSVDFDKITPTFISSFHVPKWNQTVKKSFPIVFVVEPIDPVHTHPLLLDRYELCVNCDATSARGCKEPFLNWMRVPLEPYQNKARFLAHCTPNGEEFVAVTYYGNIENFIEPSSLLCSSGASVCKESLVEYEW